jgi:hypothetical protein
VDRAGRAATIQPEIAMGQRDPPKPTPPGIIDPAARLFILPKFSSYLMKSISW